MNAPSSEQLDLPAALAGVVEALQDSTAARLALLERRLLGNAKQAAVAGLAWGVGIAAAAVAWFGANVTAALWLSAAHGVLAAAVVVTVLHAGIAAGLFRLARAHKLTTVEVLA
jgi:hypothetical protein